jgi:ABC-2 type transport system ATP-binding protein
MSISVSKLTKIYGEQKALDGISFEAPAGQVLGFLGPNGAGKTTTMKILTCYLSQTSGEARVCGHDVAKESLEVRKLVGYLPEHNPLYKDMYVREYLAFVGRANKIDRVSQRTESLIEQTGLGREAHKPIGALSKGYRQRVGLAQALMHDPQVLILDEPTSGLDPNQLAEIRKLISELGKEKTVIFSTHIMQEVQALCDRVIIINQGRLVADDPIDRLQERLRGGQVLTVEFDHPVTREKLLKIQGISRVEANPGKLAFRLYVDSAEDVRPEVFRFAVDQGLVLLGLQREDLSVEEVFRALTN